jgi:hypothetical protein
VHKQLIIKNKNNQSITLKHEKPLVLQSFNDSNGVNSSSSKSMGQDGQTYIDNDLSERQVSIMFAVVANTKEQLQTSKNNIFKVLNPKLGQVKIILGDKCIEGVVDSLPYFKIETPLYETCLINLTCHGSYYKALTEVKNQVALWQGAFEFELELDGDDGIELGYREPSLIVNVENKGQVESGMRIEFKALGTLTNPSLLNIDTGEYIKVNKIMAEGEVIRITTDYSNKKAISLANGLEFNVFKFVDFNSTWLKLNQGDNLFRYDADDGIDNLEVSIYHTNKYLGVV